MFQSQLNPIASIMQFDSFCDHDEFQSQLNPIASQIPATFVTLLKCFNPNLIQLRVVIKQGLETFIEVFQSQLNPIARTFKAIPISITCAFQSQLNPIARRFQPVAILSFPSFNPNLIQLRARLIGIESQNIVVSIPT